MNIPQVLEKVGSNKKYQVLLLVFMCLVWIQVAYMLLGPSYIFMNPTFNCEGFEEPLQEEKACPIIDTCTITNDFTVTAYAQLYCDKQFERNFVQSSMYIGSISGLIIMNIVSDKKGRKFAFVLSNSLCVLGSAFITLGAFFKTVAIMVIGQIIIGFGAYALLTISYIVMSDLCSDKLRQLGIITVNAAWALGEVSFFLIFNWFDKWQYFTIGLTFIPLVAWLVFGFFFLVQSPIYLIKIDKKKCLESLNKIALWNETPALNLTDLADVTSAEDDSKQGSALEVFTNWKYFKIVLLIATFEVSCNMFYYGTQYSMDNIGANFGVNMLIVGLLEFTAYFSSNFFIDRLPRKKTMMILNLIAGGVSFTFIFPYVRQHKSIQVFLVPFSRFILSNDFFIYFIQSTTAYVQGLLALFMNESFPDEVKSRGSGTIEALSNLGNLITPFVVSAAVNGGLEPVFIVSIILLVGIAFLIPTKETLIPKEKDLQQSLLTDGSANSVITDSE